MDLFFSSYRHLCTESLLFLLIILDTHFSRIACSPVASNNSTSMERAGWTVPSLSLCPSTGGPPQKAKMPLKEED